MRSTGDSQAGGDIKSGDRQYCEAAVIPDLIHHAIDRGGRPRACIAGEGLQSAQGCHIAECSILADPNRNTNTRGTFSFKLNFFIFHVSPACDINF